MKAVILLVCKNNLHLTKLAISSAQSQVIPTPILVVDNASNDGTPQWIRTKNGITSITLTRPKPLAKCWNMGMAASWLAGYDACLIVNNDIIMRNDTLLHLSSSNYEFISCVSDDSKENILRWTPPLVTNLHPNFSCFLIRKSVVDKVGWFDEKFTPAYFEDNDYHIRMSKAGIVARGSNLPVFHLGSSTIKNADPAEAELIRQGFDANKIYFQQKWGCLPGTPEYDALVKV